MISLLKWQRKWLLHKALQPDFLACFFSDSYPVRLVYSRSFS
jgi:hypothetical protein